MGSSSWGKRAEHKKAVVVVERSTPCSAGSYTLRRMLRTIITSMLLLALAATGCGTGSNSEGGAADVGMSSSAVPIGFEGDDAHRLLGFYFGSFLGPEGGDPVALGILEKREKSWYLRDPQAIDDVPALLQDLYAISRVAGELTEEALSAFVQEHYYAVRNFPGTLEEASTALGEWAEPAWFMIDVKGSMVPLKRRTWVRRTAIEAALDNMETLNDRVVYEAGTVFVGEHLEGADVVETTFMRKRADGHWDYWAYDSEGLLTDLVKKEPRDMLVPTRCTGCHFGDRLFEPERSYPAEARPGPEGERALYIPQSWRRADLAGTIQEHARRSDTVLGLYATLYLAEAAVSASSANDSRSPYLERFGIETSPQ